MALRDNTLQLRGTYDAVTPLRKAVPYKEPRKDIFSREMELDVAISWQLRALHGNYGVSMSVKGSTCRLLEVCLVYTP